MSKGINILVGVLVLLLVFWCMFYSGYEYGRHRSDEACNKKLKEISQKKDTTKKQVEQVAAKPKPDKKSQHTANAVKQSVAKQQRVIGDASVAVPAPAKVAGKSQLYTLRLNVVEWSQSLNDAPFSKNVGPAIRKGMTEGKIARATTPVIFRVEWRQGANRLAGGKVIWINGEARVLPVNFSSKYMIEVTTKNGQATIAMDPAMVGPETAVCVWSDTRFVTPPNGLPLVTSPGELDNHVRRGVRETYLHFVLPPPLPS